MPQHVVPQGKDQVAFCALYVHGLLLMGYSDMGLEVTSSLKCLTTKIAHEFLWRWKTLQLPFMSFPMTVKEKLIKYLKEGKIVC